MESSPVQEPCVGKPVLILCSVQLSCSVVSNSLWPHEPQYARPPCPSPTPGVHPNPWPLYHQESPVSPILSFRGFIVLCFILRSLDHFKLILMRGGIRSVSSFSLSFFFFCMWISSCSVICWKNGLYSIVFPLLLCQSSWLYLCGFIFRVFIQVPLFHLSV